MNTLLLAYAGASMPLILLFAVSDQPLDMVANSELIAVEIVRTLCGSIGLVAAVPITTALAAAVLRPSIADHGAPPEDASQPTDAQPADPEPGDSAQFADSAPSPRRARALDETSEPPPRREPRWEDFGPVEDE